MTTSKKKTVTTESSSRAEELFSRLRAGGVSEVRRLVDERQMEDLFLDFKRSANDGNSEKLHQTDRKNLAKIISGFGNGAGGVVVWGVDCSSKGGGGDLPSDERPIVSPKRFASLLTGAVSGCTIPPHVGVENHPIEIEGEDRGFVVTFVPASNNLPHQDIYRHRYYMRAGSDFVPVQHQILAGMFGRSPLPSLKHNWVIPQPGFDLAALSFEVGISIHNEGAGIARSLYVSTKLIHEIGPNCTMEFERPDPDIWTGKLVFGIFMTVVARAENLLPPGAHTIPLTISMSIAPPFDSDLEFECHFGCEGVARRQNNLKSTAEEIESAYEEAKQLAATGQLSKDQGHQIVKRILGVD